MRPLAERCANPAVTPTPKMPGSRAPSSSTDSVTAGGYFGTRYADIVTLSLNPTV